MAAFPDQRLSCRSSWSIYRAKRLRPSSSSLAAFSWSFAFANDPKASPIPSGEAFSFSGPGNQRIAAQNPWMRETASSSWAFDAA
jgi:hypothetical protein